MANLKRVHEQLTKKAAPVGFTETIDRISTLEKQAAEVEPLSGAQKATMVGAPLLLGAGGLARRAATDFGALDNALGDWEAATTNFGGGHDPKLKHMRDASETYMQRGREAMRKKILGMPLPYWVLQGKTWGEKNIMPQIGRAHAKLLELATNASPDQINAARYRFDNGIHAYEGMKNHYNMFNAASPGTTRHYMQTRSFNTALGPDGPKKFGYMYESAQPLSARLLKLKKEAPDAYVDVIKQMRQEFRDLVGNGDNLKGYASVYSQHVRPVLQKIIPKLRRLGSGSIAAGTVLGALALTTLAKRKRQMDAEPPKTLANTLRKAIGLNPKMAQSNDNVFRDIIMPTTGVATGLGMAGHGIDQLQRPLNVGVTWGEQKQWGEGHKTPGKQLYKMLQDIAAKDKGINLIRDVRGPSGIPALRHAATPFDLYMSTGMGTGAPSGWAKNPFEGLSIPGEKIHASPRKIAPGGFVGYMTDYGPIEQQTPYKGWAQQRGHTVGEYATAPTSKMERLRSWTNKQVGKVLPDQFIGWGAPVNAPAGLQLHGTSAAGPPLLDLQTVKAVTKMDKKDALANLVLNNPDVKMSDKTAKLLHNVGGKRIVTIVGSGRGDQVPVRALQLRNALKKAGKLDQVQIIAIMAGNEKYSPLSKVVAKVPEIATFGKLPREAYIGAQHAADTVIGSSGTSSLFESLGLPSKTIVHPTQDFLRRQELDLLRNKRLDPKFWQTMDSITDPDIGKQIGKRRKFFVNNFKPNKMWKDFKGDIPTALGEMFDVDLDNWNRGNKELASKAPGVFNAQTPKEWIKAIFGKDKGTAARAADTVADMGKGTARLKTSILPKLIERAKMLKRLRGAGWVGAASIPLGLGLYGLKDTFTKKPQPPPDWMDKLKANIANWKEQAMNKVTDAKDYISR